MIGAAAASGSNARTIFFENKKTIAPQLRLPGMEPVYRAHERAQPVVMPRDQSP